MTTLPAPATLPTGSAGTTAAQWISVPLAVAASVAVWAASALITPDVPGERGDEGAQLA